MPSPHAPSRVGVALVGLGFMGRAHLAALAAAIQHGDACDLVAVCDTSAERRAAFLKGDAAPVGNLNLGDAGAIARSARGCASIDDCLADSNVHLVVICTHTPTHVDLVTRAIRAGRHVLVEKPVALAASQVQELLSLARQHPHLRILPGHCMRFWPGWDWLHERVRTGDLGPLRSLTLQRLGSTPAWAGDFYGDVTRSGGALFDLHVHDADVVAWLLGEPSHVASTGSPAHVTTHYHFAHGPAHVVAEGAWDLHPAAGFRMRYLACFEKATADFDLSREHRLMLHDASGSRAIPLDTVAGYTPQLRHLIAAILNPSLPLRVTLADAERVARLLEAEHRSLSGGGTLVSLSSS